MVIFIVNVKYSSFMAEFMARTLCEMTSKILHRSIESSAKARTS